MVEPTCHTPQPLDAILICFKSWKAADELHAQRIQKPCSLNGADRWLPMPVRFAYV